MARRKKIPAGFTIRKDGKYQFAFMVDGKRYFVYGDSIEECNDKRDELRDRIKKGLTVTKNMATLSQYYEIWQERRKGQVKQSTIYANDRRFKRIKAKLGHKKLKDITRPDVYSFQTECRKELSSKGVNDEISLLKQILQSAVDDRIIPYNPAASVKAVKKTTAEKQKDTHRYLSAAEIESFFTYAKGSVYYNLFYFLLLTGMRCGEAGALTWRDIDSEAGVIHITKTVTRADDRTYLIGDPKTEDSKRDIELTPQIKTVLDNQRQQQAALLGIRAVKDSERIFTTINGGLITQSNTCPTIANICRKTSETDTPVRYFTPHAFRHTFITYELEKKVPLNDIARQVGHNNTLTLQKYYSHEDPETVRAAFRMVSEDMTKIVQIS